MTAWSSGTLVMDALQRGARDFIEKPWNDSRLAALVRSQVELGRDDAGLRALGWRSDEVLGRGWRMLLSAIGHASARLRAAGTAAWTTARVPPRPG